MTSHSAKPAPLSIGSCDALEYSPISGKLAAATSQLTGPTWDGALVVVDESGSLVKSIPILAGANNLAWMGNKEKELLVCSCDDGTIQIWNASAKGKADCVKYIVEHDDVATAVSVRPTHYDSMFLSSSWDRTIKEWDITKSSQTTYRGHVNFVWDVQWNNKATDLFISASEDKTAKTWDRRQQKPTAEYKSDLPVLTASWNPQNEYIFAFGDAMGSVYIHDSRNTQDAINQSFRGHTAAVRKVRFSLNENESWLATVSDDTMVIVWDWKSLKSVYSYKHEDFARGLAWTPSKPKHLVSGGWDKSILFHSFLQ